MIKGKSIAAAVLCAAALTGCGSSGFPKQYKKDLDRSLGKYTISEPTEYNDGHKEWDISFTDKNGTEQKAVIVYDEFDDEQKNSHVSKEDLIASNIYNFHCDAMTNIAGREMWDNILSEHFDLEYSREHSMENDDIMVVLNISPTISLFLPEKCRFIMDDEISGKNGVKLTEEDLRSIVARDHVTTIFALNVNEDVDPEPYIQKIRTVLAEFEEYDPRNYLFRVKIRGTATSLFSEMKMLGEKIDESDLRDEDGFPLQFRNVLYKKIADRGE